MYHDIVPTGADDSSGFPGRDAALYKVTPDTFEAHLAALERLASQLIITFDDGGVSAVEAADALERHGRRGHFFMTVNYIGAPRFLSAVQLRELQARGHLVGSHSCSHPLRMAHCSDRQVRQEWADSRARLCDILGADVQMASVPGGDYTDHVALAASAAGFTTLFTSEPTTAVRRVEQTVVLGRFTVQKWTTPATVAALANGRWAARTRQGAFWTAKKIAKRLGGAGYLQVRKFLLRHDDAVAWGDGPADLAPGKTRQ